MSDLTDKEKLERRRQKRLNKILQSGESRLNKITGTTHQYKTNPPVPSPSVSYVPKSNVEHIPSMHRSVSDGCFRPRRDSDDPSEELGAPPPLDMNDMMSQTLFNNMFNQPSPSQSTSTDTRTSIENPLENLFSASGLPFNPALLASIAGNNMNGVSNADTENKDTSLKYWNLLHLIMMCLLGMYAVYTEWTTVGVDRLAALLHGNTLAVNYPAMNVPLFWYYITLELCMQSARLFYQQGNIESTSTIAMIATQLPDPIGNIATILLRYRLIWTCLVQDCCILIFIIGLSEVISSLLVGA
ncbi:hypothetical protein BDB01DRAFT_785299 [Pilobolus umbonatus]|nr:hypothetical protein BDB01DRAFT_785299 [Pilobolus umbonatus]